MSDRAAERARAPRRARDVAALVRTGARGESTRRRLMWVAVAAALTLGPIAFNLAREPRFEASVEVFPHRVASFPAIADPGYYRRLLHDAELRREMARNVGRGIARYDEVTIRRWRGRKALVVTAAAETPRRASRVVNALGPQLANATGRRLASAARLRADGLRARLRARIPATQRPRLRRELRDLERLARAPVHRVVVGARASDPRPTRWTDRVADALPGSFPPRHSPAASGVSGLVVTTALWAFALVLSPPGRAPRRRHARRSRRPGVVGPSADAPLPPWALALGAGALIASGAFILWVGRGQVFLTDEWAFVLERREWSLDAFLRPHNEHLMAVPAAVFKGLFATVGLEPYWPYRAAVAVAHLACVALVFLFARRRVGAAFAALLVAPVVAFGPGFDVILFPINLGFLGSTLAGLGMLFALDREDPRGDAAAGLLLLVALASSSLGAPFALGAAAELLWRRDSWRRFALILAPATLYGAWYLGYNLEPNRQGPVEIADAPVFAFHAAAGAVSALYGAPLGIETLGRGYHRPLELLSYLVLGLGLVALAIRIRRPGALTARLVLLGVTLGSFWLATGAARAYSQGWYASRYVYPAAILLLTLVAEACRGARLSWRPAVVAAPVALAVAAVNAGWLVEAGDRRRADAEILAAALGAVELARESVPPRLVIDEQRARHVTAAGYFEAIDELGSPGLSPSELVAASPPARVGADSVLARAVVEVRPYDPRGPRPVFRPTLRGSALAFAQSRGGCVEVRPPGRAVSAVLDLPAHGLAVVPLGRVTVQVRRFGPVYLSAPPLRDRRYGSGLVVAPRDRSARPWRVRVSGAVPFRMC